jgi:hypothetical protein
VACESTRGEWGGICPACGERLPKPFSRTAYFAERERERDARLYLYREVSASTQARMETMRQSKLAGRTHVPPTASPLTPAHRRPKPAAA